MLSGLVTNRSQKDVDRRANLAAKGWNNMTSSERAEWTGDVLQGSYSGGVNLIPNNRYYSDVVALEFKNKTITATARTSGVYRYAVIIIGAAELYEQTAMTLSIDSLVANGTGTPMVALYWHDDNGYEPVPGASLSAAGSVTFNTQDNDMVRRYLALYVYATTDSMVTVGDSITYAGLMLEIGEKRHPYTPYEEALPTSPRKGSYNYTDLNRVERAVKELATELNLDLTTKTDWTAWDIPKQADMERYIYNIVTLRTVGAVGLAAPLPPSQMKNLDYSAANNIEKILQFVSKNADAAIRSGDIFCGEM